MGAGSPPGLSLSIHVPSDAVADRPLITRKCDQRAACGFLRVFGQALQSNGLQRDRLPDRHGLELAGGYGADRSQVGTAHAENNWI